VHWIIRKWTVVSDLESVTPLAALIDRADVGVEFVFAAFTISGVVMNEVELAAYGARTLASVGSSNSSSQGAEPESIDPPSVGVVVARNK